MNMEWLAEDLVMSGRVPHAGSLTEIKVIGQGLKNGI